MEIDVRKTASLNYNLDEKDMIALFRTSKIFCDLENMSFYEDKPIYLTETDEQLDFRYLGVILDAIISHEIHC